MSNPNFFWGKLIRRDKNPSPLLEQLLLGVANYINKHVAPWDINCLTPAKLATFYRLVGGDYDALFLDTPQTSLSFIYRSLGCFHTLQPEQDPYDLPTLPALTPQGFVRWQTVQLLLEPNEHVPFLQEAVKRLEIINPVDGEPFPSVLPKEALPTKPDPAMTDWHESVSEKLMVEARASQNRSLPPRPPMALNDGDLDNLRPPSTDSLSIGSQSVIDAAAYLQHSPRYGNTRDPARPNIPRRVNIPPSWHDSFRQPDYETPCSPLRRRSSMPPDRGQRCFSASWPHGNSTHGSMRQSRDYQRRARTPSTVSTDSYTSESSFSCSSASNSPVRHHAHSSFGFPPGQSDRRHSTHLPSNAPSGYMIQQQSPAPLHDARWQEKGRRMVTLGQLGSRGVGEQNRRNARSVDGRPMDRWGEERAKGARFIGRTNGGRRRFAGQGWR